MRARPLLCLACAWLLAGAVPVGRADEAAPDAATHGGLWRLFDGSTLPFIPVPDIDVDPNSGTTLGLIPVWLKVDAEQQIRRIIAPAVLYNPNFGVGVRMVVFAYPSDDTQWTLAGGADQRVQSEFDAGWVRGRTRQGRWTFNARIDDDVSGTPRFYGIGNNSPVIAETDYTNQQKLVEATVGWNLNHEWQLAYMARVHSAEVRPGTLAQRVSIERRFGRILGVGLNHEILHRLLLSFDSRDDESVPTRGSRIVLFGGFASREGVLNESLYSEIGGDARHFWRLGSTSVLAGHLAVRYLPVTHNVPFWALSSLGGNQSVLGGEQPLRGFGEGRFYDRDSFSASLELRHRVASFEALSTHIELEITPFTDMGRVFAHAHTSPFSRLHHVAGVGFRGVARPFVVGFVDLGYGSEGLAVFTGINYPF